MSIDSGVPVPGSTDGVIVLLGPNELLERYADAAAQADLLKGLLKLAARISARRTKPVAVPVRVHSSAQEEGHE